MASISCSTTATLERRRGEHRGGSSSQESSKKKESKLQGGTCGASVKATSLEDGQLLPGTLSWGSRLQPQTRSRLRLSHAGDDRICRFHGNGDLWADTLGGEVLVRAGESGLVMGKWILVRIRRGGEWLGLGLGFVNFHGGPPKGMRN